MDFILLSCKKLQCALYIELRDALEWDVYVYIYIDVAIERLVVLHVSPNNCSQSVCILLD